MGFNKDKDNEVDGAQISHNGLTRSLKSGALGVGTMSHHVLLQYIYSVPPGCHKWPSEEQHRRARGRWWGGGRGGQGEHVRGGLRQDEEGGWSLRDWRSGSQVGWWRRQLASRNGISTNSRIHELTFFFTFFTWNEPWWLSLGSVCSCEHQIKQNTISTMFCTFYLTKASNLTKTFKRPWIQSFFDASHHVDPLLSKLLFQ